MKARIEKKSEEFKPYDLIITIESKKEEDALLDGFRETEISNKNFSPTNVEFYRYLQDVINLKIAK